MGCGGSRVHPVAQKRRPPLSGSELAALRDAEGALSERAASLLRQAAFERGVAPDARAGTEGAWALLLGIFPMGSTRAQREELLAQKAQAYAEYRDAGAALAADPGFKDGSVIVHDVHRTQAGHPLHEAHKPVMTEVLRAYAAFDPEVGYGQGMSDMLAVILYTLEDAVLSFWCARGGPPLCAPARSTACARAETRGGGVAARAGALQPCCVDLFAPAGSVATTRGVCILPRMWTMLPALCSAGLPASWSDSCPNFMDT
jgi:hypothetical protein